ncbi:LysM peptidoglycan-binding domain-containing protein [Microcella alkaliphila]|uniref:Conserved ypothetical protein n=1 Tax=Microcella alkaliphila TaxID=279828 RepID=A0A0U5BFL9_9MICO|nr:LysM peptidoglycan-binding domain-containing protein [Microcella alkaliphila]BAU31982.1 conserved ypothetical protein [Microcella alkaliphila]
MTTIDAGAFPTIVRSADASSAPVATRLRLTRRGRAVITTLVTAPIVALVVALALSGGEATATSGDVVLPVVTVEAGQTLWQLAGSVAPGANPADLVADIITLNGLDSAAVMPGQTLLLPERYLD